MKLILLALVAFVSTAWAQELEEAKKAFNKGDYATAAKLFEAANRRRPDCANLFYAGLARYRMNQVNEALISFKAAVQCNPKLIDAHLALAEAYAERGNVDEALTAFTEVLRVYGKSAPALRGAAALYMRQDAKEKAQPLLETLLSVDPKDAQAYVDLAAIKASSGDRSGAEAQFREALSLKPDFPPALTGLGNLYLRAGDDQKALPLLERSAAVQPKAWQPHFLLGSAWNRVGQFDKALAELQRAAELGGSGEPEVFYHLARAYGGLNRPDDRRQALSKFSELTKKAKADTETQRRAYRLVEEARSFVQSGNLTGAISSLEQAREAMPGDATLLFRLAGLHFDLQRYDQAREYAQAAISISPSAWLYHYLLGLIEKSSGKWPEAGESLTIAAQLNPSAAEVHNALGEVAMHNRDWKSAIGSFDRANQLAPRETAYQQNLEAARKAAAK